MSPHTAKPGRTSGEERPKTAVGEVLRSVEEAETRDVDGHERRGQDREAADALTPNEDAQEDVKTRHA